MGHKNRSKKKRAALNAEGLETSICRFGSLHRLLFCNHSYRVMDDLSFPLTCPDWSVHEELLLLEALDMYGFANWNGVAEHVGTKSESRCIGHYNDVYLNLPSFPLPDLSYSMRKNKEELIAMAKGD
ncbi:myb-like DNA-binding domain protein [Medicago truncatula]|uniref:Myb-like DNA-binding domain protein n=1 Tax=Medicago truncatula TaxID=3880 RepID=A0A072V0E7_MEDTR|nr:myb-like DNA-binding domain protein [Medicago truncatula]